jgi:hypothetical protein
MLETFSLSGSSSQHVSAPENSGNTLPCQWGKVTEPSKMAYAVQPHNVARAPFRWLNLFEEFFLNT